MQEHKKQKKVKRDQASKDGADIERQRKRQKHKRDELMNAARNAQPAVTMPF